MGKTKRLNLKKMVTGRDNVICLVLGVTALGLVMAWAAIAWYGPEKLVSSIERSDFGGSSKIVSAIVSTEFQGKTVEKEVELIIGSRNLSEEEKNERFAKLKEELPGIVLGENKSADAIVTDLNLIEEDEETGISLVWESSNTNLIGADGSVYPFEGEVGDYVQISAILSLDGSEEEWKCNVRHMASLTADNYETAFGREVDQLKEELSLSDSEKVLDLPAETRGGQILTWREKQDRTLLILAFFAVILIFAIKAKRRSEEKKALEERQDEIRREFPYFLDKLVMLLSAGLILREAVERIADDYRRYTDEKHNKVLYEELCTTVQTMNETNSSLSSELLKLSERLGVREFARLSVILRDSLESGMELAAKLTQESELMWTERRSAVQKLGRTADTRLVFPLMIILIVLIVIVMAPAIMQM